MRMRHIASGLALTLVAFAGSGCKKSAPAPATTVETTVARLHWLGKKQLATETNAANFMKIWDEPESAKVESQTLDKLALAPWRLGLGNTNATLTNTPARLLRPLLDDLVQQESYLEVRQPANPPGELALAVRFDAQRTALWETNLAAVLESLTGTKPTPAEGGAPGWQLRVEGRAEKGKGRGQKSEAGGQSPSSILRPPFSTLTFARSGDWTLFGLAPERNALIEDFQRRIQRDHIPFTPPKTNFWLTGELDLRRLGAALSLNWSQAKDTPTASIRVIGDGENVLTRGQLSFSKPLAPVSAAWTIPTNLVPKVLLSFTAMRGVGPLLRSSAPFASLPPDCVPDQVCAWDVDGAPFEMFIACPVKNPVELVRNLAPLIINSLNPRLTSFYGSISFDTNSLTLNWQNMPHATPFLRPITNPEPGFVFGGFGPASARPGQVMPPELLAHVRDGTNMIYFDWELTGGRLVHWRYLDDVYRLAFDNHGPRLGNTPSLEWVARNLTNLSHSVTELRIAAPDRLAFARKSTVGLTALEIDLLANWLELPEFPCGLRTLMATNPVPIIKPRRHPVLTTPP